MELRRRATIVMTACIAGMLGSYLYAGILNPQNVEWLLNEGDLLQHYLGWQFYRHESWAWPLGVLQTYGTEVRSSIVFTDSLPLFAIPLKLFQAWLPNPFQYQGLAVLAHIIMNATAACFILTRLKLPLLAAVALSLVVAFMPAVIFRGPGGAGHESLMAHWVLLFGLYLLFFETNSHWATCAKWAVLLTIAVMVHFYLFLLVGIFWSLWWLLQTLARWRNKEGTSHNAYWWSWGAYSALQPIIILAVMWAVGYLHSTGESPGAEGFGFYSAELFAYFNGYSFLSSTNAASAWLPKWEPAIEGQYEGMSYIGLGVILLWAAALLLAVRWPIKIEPEKKWHVYSIMALATGLFIFALADRVVVGSLFSFSLPVPWPEPLQAVLRASGRMVWVLMYVATFAAAFVLVKRLSSRAVILASLLIFMVQAADLYRWHGYFYHYSQHAASYQMTEDPRFIGWETPQLQQVLSERKALHITHADDIVGMLPLAWLAGQHSLTINVAYVARITLPIIHKASAPTLQALAAGQPDPNVVYAITSPDKADEVCNNQAQIHCLKTPIATFAWQPL